MSTNGNSADRQFRFAMGNLAQGSYSFPIIHRSIPNRFAPSPRFHVGARRVTGSGDGPRGELGYMRRRQEESGETPGQGWARPRLGHRLGLGPGRPARVAFAGEGIVGRQVQQQGNRQETDVMQTLRTGRPDGIPNVVDRDTAKKQAGDSGMTLDELGAKMDTMAAYADENRRMIDHLQDQIDLLEKKNKEIKDVSEDAEDEAPGATCCPRSCSVM